MLINGWDIIVGIVLKYGYLVVVLRLQDLRMRVFLKKEKMSFEEFKEEFSDVLGNTLAYFQEDSQKAFDIIKKIDNPEEFKKLKKYSEKIEEELTIKIKEYEEKKEKLGNINFFYYESKYPIKKALSAIISRNNPEETIIFVTPQDENQLSISARNQTRKVDMTHLLKEATKNLEGANSGGHVPAAGATIKTKDLEKFKEKAREFEG